MSTSESQNDSHNPATESVVNNHVPASPTRTTSVSTPERISSSSSTTRHPPQSVVIPPRTKASIPKKKQRKRKSHQQQQSSTSTSSPGQDEQTNNSMSIEAGDSTEQYNQQDQDEGKEHDHEHEGQTQYGNEREYLGEHDPEQYLEEQRNEEKLSEFVPCSFRITRDYSSGEICQFSTAFPPQLHGLVSPTQHLSTMNTLNSLLASAHDPYKCIFDNVFSIFSLYIRDLVGIKGHYAKEMERFHQALQIANNSIYMPSGLRILDPKPVAYLFLDVVVYHA